MISSQDELFEPKIHWLCSLFDHKWQLCGQSSSMGTSYTYVHERSYGCRRGCSVSFKVLNRSPKPKEMT